MRPMVAMRPVPVGKRACANTEVSYKDLQMGAERMAEDVQAIIPDVKDVLEGARGQVRVDLVCMTWPVYGSIFKPEI